MACLAVVDSDHAASSSAASGRDVIKDSGSLRRFKSSQRLTAPPRPTSTMSMTRQPRLPRLGSRVVHDSTLGVQNLAATTFPTRQTRRPRTNLVSSTTRPSRCPRLDGLRVDSVRRIIYAYTDSTAVDIVHASASASWTTASVIEPLWTNSFSTAHRQTTRRSGLIAV